MTNPSRLSADAVSEAFQPSQLESEFMIHFVPWISVLVGDLLFSYG